jgi:hypothetical protein
MNGSDNMSAIRQFCNQFVRNHANNRQLVPSIDFQDKTLLSVDSETGDIEFGAPVEEEYKLSRIMLGDTNPYEFITVIRKNGNSLTQELYELVEVGGEKQFTEAGMTKVRYRKSNRLGLTNNFIEYDANSSIETSYFEDIRSNSADDMDEEIATEGQSKDEQEQSAGNSTPSDGSEAERSFTYKWNTFILPVIRNLKGSQAGKEGAKYRVALKHALEKADDNSEFAKAFNAMLEAKQEDRQGLMDKINEIFKNQNSCFKG